MNYYFNMKERSIKELELNSIMVDEQYFVAVYAIEEIAGYENERIFLTYLDYLNSDSVYLFRATISEKQIRMSPDEYERYHEFCYKISNGISADKYKILNRFITKPVPKENLLKLAK